MRSRAGPRGVEGDVDAGVGINPRDETARGAGARVALRAARLGLNRGKRVRSRLNRVGHVGTLAA